MPEPNVTVNEEEDWERHSLWRRSDEGQFPSMPDSDLECYDCYDGPPEENTMQDTEIVGGASKGFSTYLRCAGCGLGAFDGEGKRVHSPIADIDNCPRCGENHVRLQFQYMQHKPEYTGLNFTHFALCPETQTPIMMRYYGGVDAIHR